MRAFGILMIALLTPGAAFLAFGFISLNRILGEGLFRLLIPAFDLFGFLLTPLISIAIAWPLIRLRARSPHYGVNPARPLHASRPIFRTAMALTAPATFPATFRSPCARRMASRWLLRRDIRMDRRIW